MYTDPTGNVSVSVNGYTVGNSIINSNGSTTGNLTDIITGLGGTTAWNGSTSTATVSIGGNSVSFNLNSVVNGVGTASDGTKFTVINGKIQVGVRDVSERVGNSSVTWNGSSQSVTVSTSDNQLVKNIVGCTVANTSAVSAISMQYRQELKDTNNVNNQNAGQILSIDYAIKGVSGNSTVIQGQGYLTVMGFPIGTSGPNSNGVDASWGNMGKASTKLFQQMMRLPQTGELDAATLAKMKECADSGQTLKQLAKNAYNSGIRPEIVKGSTQAERVNAIYFYALIDEDISGVPAAITAAQAIQESNAGNSIPTDKYDGTYSYNMFGIKANKKWLNTGGEYVISNTWEEVNGKKTRVDAKFRAYDSYSDSISDHSKFLTDNSNYSSLFKIQKDDNYLENWARGLQKAGYATDSGYANALISHINTYGLK